MSESGELECVSCETTFDPAPNGGFCPDCDTPHPEYDLEPDEEPEDAPAEEESAPAENEGGASADEEVGASDGEAADPPADEEAGAAAEEGDESADEDATGDAEADDADDEPATVECGGCGATVDASVSFCPDCGTEVGTEPSSSDLAACPDCGNSIDDESYCPDCGLHLDPIRAGEEPADASDDEAAADDAAAGAPETVTLVVAGEEYTFGDGDTFGRQDAAWLEDLVAAAGGREAVTYISGDHLEFDLRADGMYVTDVSTNGTARNGSDLDGDTAKLEDGDVLELAGRAEVEVVL